MALLQKMSAVAKPEHDMYESTFPTNPSNQYPPPESWAFEPRPDSSGLFSLQDLPSLEKAFPQKSFDDPWSCATDTDSETSSGDSDDSTRAESPRPSYNSHATAASNNTHVPNAWKCCRCGAARWSSSTTHALRPSPFLHARNTEKCAGVIVSATPSNQRNLCENTGRQSDGDGTEVRECGHVQCSACPVGTFARARRVPTTVLFGVEGECWEGVALETGWELDFVRWE